MHWRYCTLGGTEELIKDRADDRCPEYQLVVDFNTGIKTREELLFCVPHSCISE